MNDKQLKSLSLLAVLVTLLLATLAAGCTTQQTATPAATDSPAVTPTAEPETRTITDMAGRSVIVPYHIGKVLGTAPPITMTTYMLAPDRLQGWNSNVTSPNYVPAQYLTLPNVGGQQMGQMLNYETFLAMNPDLVLYGFNIGAANVNTSIDDMQTKLNPLPVVAVLDTTNVSNYAPEIRFIGDLLGEPEKAEKLVAFNNKVYTKVNGTVASIPVSERKKVYYAEGAQGLQTESPVSQHAQIIAISGGINVADIKDTGSGGMTPVSIEQVVAWNPDVIVAGDAGFYKKVYSDPNWQNIKAVKEKQVYLIPNKPYGWIDRPPGVNSIIGIPWMAKVLYPEKFKDVDMKSLTKEFYSDFYHYDLTDEEVKTILDTSGLKAD